MKLERPTTHESLTCKNHPHLRWSTKRIPGRSLFFCGEVKRPIQFYSDYSGVQPQNSFVQECDCKPDCLVEAPEDKFLRGECTLEEFRAEEANREREAEREFNRSFGFHA